MFTSVILISMETLNHVWLLYLNRDFNYSFEKLVSKGRASGDEYV